MINTLFKKDTKKIFQLISFLCGLPIFGINNHAEASENIATLTQLEGNAKIFSRPSKTPTEGENGSRILFEGEYYHVKDAHTGDQVDNGEIFRTSPNAKARLVYPNGDQINVGPGSAYRIFWHSKASPHLAQDETQINLMYGKLRGIIEKGGPRSRLQVRTHSAVMGVRGTDFFVSDEGENDDVAISIIRGKVDVKTKPHEKPVSIAAGYSARVETKEAIKAPVLNIDQTSKVEYVSIQKASSIDPHRAEKTTSTQQQEHLAVLEKKATQTTLKDIQSSDPALYASLQKQRKDDLRPDDLNKVAMRELVKKAPELPVHHKPGKNEMERLEDGAYDKYFKLNEG